MKIRISCAGFVATVAVGSRTDWRLTLRQGRRTLLDARQDGLSMSAYNAGTESTYGQGVIDGMELAGASPNGGVDELAARRNPRRSVS